MNFVWCFSLLILQVYGGFPYIKSNLGNYAKCQLMVMWGCLAYVSLTCLNIWLCIQKALQFYDDQTFSNASTLIMFICWYSCIQLALTNNVWFHQDLKRILQKIELIKSFPQEIALKYQFIIMCISAIWYSSTIVYPVYETTGYLAKVADVIEGLFLVYYIVSIVVLIKECSHCVEEVITSNNRIRIPKNDVVTLRKLSLVKKILKMIYSRHTMDFLFQITSFSFLLVYYISILQSDGQVFDFWSVFYNVMMGSVILFSDLPQSKVRLFKTNNKSKMLVIGDRTELLDRNASYSNLIISAFKNGQIQPFQKFLISLVDLT